MEKQMIKGAKRAILAGTIVAGSILATSASNLFSFRALGTGSDVRTELSGSSNGSMNFDLKCGAGKGDSTKMKDGKCGTDKKGKDGKCGAKKGKSKDGKCGDGKCGGKK